jgi:hypothetical protein
MQRRNGHGSSHCSRLGSMRRRGSRSTTSCPGHAKFHRRQQCRGLRTGTTAAMGSTNSAWCALRLEVVAGVTIRCKVMRAGLLAAGSTSGTRAIAGASAGHTTAVVDASGQSDDLRLQIDHFQRAPCGPRTAQARGVRGNEICGRSWIALSRYSVNPPSLVW